MTLTPNYERIVHVPHCLADDVRELEKQGSSQQAYIALLEEWRRKVLLVDMVLERETTFTEAYDIIYFALGGWKVLYPVSFPEKYRELIDDLQQTTAIIGVQERDVLVGNPVTFVGLVTPIALVTSPLYTVSERRLPTRREVLVGTGIIGAGFGLASGMLGSGLRLGYMLRQRENAEYLDNKVQEVYRV